MHLSVFSDELHIADVSTALDTLVGWGVQYVDFRARLFGKPIHKLSTDELKQLKGLVDERGLSVSALQSSLGKVHFPDADRHQRELDAVDGLIRAADILDCNLVRAFNYWQPGEEHHGELAKQPDQVAKVLEAFAPIAQRAQAGGLRLAFENCGQSTTDVHAVLDGLNVADWGLAWDPYDEWNRCPERDDDEVAYLMKQSARSLMLHVKAHSIVPALGEPALPWSRIISTYLASGGTGPVCVETHNRPGSPLDHVEASRQTFTGLRKAWPAHVQPEPRDAATPRSVPWVPRPWADNPLRIVVVGLGMGRNRARTIIDTNGCELAGVCDLNEERAQKVGEEFGVPWSTDLNTFLQDDTVEAVFILTETGTHLAIAQQIIAAGKHVLTTKPVEVTLERSNDMIALADEAGVVLAVDFERRYMTEVLELNRALNDGWFGQPLAVHSHLKIWRPERYFTANGGWHGTWAKDGGGTFSNQCIHLIDELIFHFGMPERVRCICRTQTKPIEAEDIGFATWEYANGLLVELSSTTSWKPSFWYDRFELMGEDACFMASSGSPEGTISKWWKDKTWSNEAPVQADSEYLNSVDNLAAHLRTGAPLTCDGRDGARPRQVLDAMYLSSRGDGGWVGVDSAGTVIEKPVTTA